MSASARTGTPPSAPKSASDERTVPLTRIVFNALREWRFACPKGTLDLVFPTGPGKVEYHANIDERGLKPIQIAAGVTVTGLGQDGKPKVQAKHPGLHAFRYFDASWCINRRADGGLELPAKVVQDRLGHSSIMMTMDV
jgi:integrase